MGNSYCWPLMFSCAFSTTCLLLSVGNGQTCAVLSGVLGNTDAPGVTAR